MPATGSTFFILIAVELAAKQTNYLFPKVKLLLAATHIFLAFSFSGYKTSLYGVTHLPCAFSEIRNPKEKPYMPQLPHAQLATTQISVINESTGLTDAEVTPVVIALQQQVTNDFRPVWGLDA
jgi:hypothetical protein